MFIRCTVPYEHVFLDVALRLAAMALLRYMTVLPRRNRAARSCWVSVVIGSFDGN